MQWVQISTDQHWILPDIGLCTTFLHQYTNYLIQNKCKWCVWVCVCALVYLLVLFLGLVSAGVLGRWIGSLSAPFRWVILSWITSLMFLIHSCLASILDAWRREQQRNYYSCDTSYWQQTSRYTYLIRGKKTGIFHVPLAQFYYQRRGFFRPTEQICMDRLRCAQSPPTLTSAGQQGSVQLPKMWVRVWLKHTVDILTCKHRHRHKVKRGDESKSLE